LKETIVEFVDQGPAVSIIVDAVLSFSVIMKKSAFAEKNHEVNKKYGLHSKLVQLK
jgi:hypothetical protein